jgi:hypothetical protein
VRDVVECPESAAGQLRDPRIPATTCRSSNGCFSVPTT